MATHAARQPDRSIIVCINGSRMIEPMPTPENATLTEYFTRHTDFGTDYFTVIAVIADAAGNHTTSSTFKKEPNGSKFSPTGCEIVK